MDVLGEDPADATADPAAHFQYFWWIAVERPGRFYALGNFGQYIYVAPDANTVIVRNGSDWGVAGNVFEPSRITSTQRRYA